MDKAFKFITLALSVATLSACVTQQYQNSNTPVVKSDTSNTEIAMTRISLGLNYLKKGNTTQAKLNLEKAKKFAPDLVQVYTAFAHYFETVGEDQQTIEAYEKALSLKPDDADTLNNYGVYLCRQDMLPQAEKQFLRAIAVPSYLLVSQSYENLALCQLRAPNFEKAEQYLQKAIDHNPSNAAILYQMMRLKYAMAEYEQALKFSQRYEKSTRRFKPEALALAFKIHQKLANVTVSKNYASTLVSMFPKSWHARQYMLNELHHTDADDLAEQYQLLQIDAFEPIKKKKVVVLSPNSKPAINISSRKSRTKQTVSPNEIKKTVKTLKAPSSTNVASVKSSDTEAKSDTPKRVVNLSPDSEDNSQSFKPKEGMVANKLPNEIAIREKSTDSDGRQTVTLKTSSPENSNVGDQIVDAETELGSLADVAEQVVKEKPELELVGVENFNTSQNQTKQEATAESDLVTQADELVEQLVAEQTGQTQELNPDQSTSHVGFDDGNIDEEVMASEAVEQVDLSTDMRSEIENASQPDELSAEQSVSNLQEQASDLETFTEQTEIMDDEVRPVFGSLDDLPQHVIAAGENLFTLSKRYNIHLRSLRKWNGLDEDSVIHIDDVIYLDDPSLVETTEDEQ